jgi:hypothetical protein
MMELNASGFKRLATALDYCLFSETKPSRKLCALALSVIFVTVLITILWLGAAPIETGAWDAILLLNGAWRICSGQIPHSDYHTPIGPLPYLLVAAGMKIASPSMTAIPIGTVLLTCFLLPLAWRISASRLPPLFAFLYVLFSGFLLVAPRPLGLGIRQTSYEMIYNREADVLISLFFIILFLPRLKDTEDKPVSDGLFIGFLLALVLYCKITYFIVAIASLALGVILRWRSWTWCLAVGTAFLSVCAAAYLLFDIGLWSYFHDVTTAGRSQSMAMRITYLKHGLKINLPWLCLIVACLGLWTYFDRTSGKTWQSLVGLWVTALWIMGVSMGIDAGNTSGIPDDPLFFIGALIAFEQFRRRHREQMQLANRKVRLVYIASYLIILPHFCCRLLYLDATSFSYAMAWDYFKRPVFEDSRRLHAGPLHDLCVPDGSWLINPYWYASDFPAKMNDGLDLLHKHLSGNDRVTTFGYTDPFSFAFGLKPSRDAFQYWDEYSDFDIHNHPTPEEFLGSATLVMIPICDPRYQSAASRTLDVMMKLYQNYLQENFELLDTSQDWSLYRRRLPALKSAHSL